MNPWTIIGWALVIGAVLYALWKWILPWAVIYYLHRKSRKIEPVAGQTWVFPVESGKPRVTVEYVNTEKNFVVLRKGSSRAYSSWSVDLAEWPVYMRSHLLIMDDQ